MKRFQRTPYDWKSSYQKKWTFGQKYLKQLRKWRKSDPIFGYRIWDNGDGTFTAWRGNDSIEITYPACATTEIERHLDARRAELQITEQAKALEKAAKEAAKTKGDLDQFIAEQLAKLETTENSDGE